MNYLPELNFTKKPYNLFLFYGKASVHYEVIV